MSSQTLVDQPTKSCESQFMGQYIPLHYHYNMLQDRARVEAFRDAIAFCVKPDMHVVELGGGTGILSYLAATQGATVTCVERNPELVQNARHFLELNKLGEQVNVVQADACDFVPQQPVDVVVCEMLHVAMLREKQLEVIAAFKLNYQAAFPDLPLPRFIPEASLMMVQPVEQSFDFVGYWAPVPMFQTPLIGNERTQELGGLSIYASIFYEQSYPTSFSFRGQIEIQRAGRMNALRFLTQNALAIDIASQQSINWPNQLMVLPIREPLDLVAGQVLDIEFAYAAGEAISVLSESLQVSITEGRQQQNSGEMTLLRDSA